MLVCPGSPNPFPNLYTPPRLEEGMSFALSNNLWGTNYPMWIPYTGEDATLRFRFVVELEDAKGPMPAGRAGDLMQKHARTAGDGSGAQARGQAEELYELWLSPQEQRQRPKSKLAAMQQAALGGLLIIGCLAVLGVLLNRKGLQRRSTDASSSVLQYKRCLAS